MWAICSLFRFPTVEKKSIYSASLFEKDCLGHFCDCRWETHFLLLHVCFVVYLYLISPSPSGHTLLRSPAQAECVCVCVCVVCASFDMASLQSQRKEVGCWEAGWRLRWDQQIKARPVRWMQAGGRTDTRVLVSSPTRRTQQDDPTQSETRILTYMQLVGAAGGLLYSGSWFDHTAGCCV